MIYSFLDQEFNQKLGVNPDFSYQRESRGNTFNFYLKRGNFVAEEIEHCYEDKDLINTIKIQLNKGDHIIASSVSGLTLIQLTKMGVKVSLLNSDLVELPLEEQTEDIKANLVYSLISLDVND